MRQKKIVLKELFPSIDFIGTRPSGEKVRSIMERAFEKGDTVSIDFEKIDGITQGFGDEIIGIYCRYNGKDFIRQNIKAINYNGEIKEVLNWIIDYSSSWHKENKDKLQGVNFAVA